MVYGMLCVYNISGGVVNFDIRDRSAERIREIFRDLKRLWSHCGKFSRDDVGAVLCRKRTHPHHEGDISGNFCAVSVCVALLYSVEIQNIRLVVVVSVESEEDLFTDKAH